FHDEAIVDSQVAGDEAVPHSNDSIDNEADDEYDYSDSFIDDEPIVDEPTLEDLSDSDLYKECNISHFVSLYDSINDH
ncbi:hypothetical protein Tco_0602633, partial [Tanacetum coccineum]